MNQKNLNTTRHGGLYILITFMVFQFLRFCFYIVSIPLNIPITIVDSKISLFAIALIAMAFSIWHIKKSYINNKNKL